MRCQGEEFCSVDSAFFSSAFRSFDDVVRIALVIDNADLTSHGLE